MVICFIALPILLILAIFSAEYRQLAKEAFDCVFRKATFRKCRTNFDQKIKSRLVGRLMTKNPGLAGFVFRNFESLSTLFVLLLVASIGIVGYGGYNYYLYGNCYGPESTAYCPFTGEQTTNIDTGYTGSIIMPTVDDDPSIGPENASVTIIEFGCYLCQYTADAQPVVKQILEEYKGRIRFVFRDFSLSEKHAKADWHAGAANCANEQGKFWEFHNALFSQQASCAVVEDHIDALGAIAAELGLDMDKFNSCLESKKYEQEIVADFNDGIKAGVDGTPYFFINNRTIVGPKKLAAFTSVIDDELAKAEKAATTGAIVQK